MGATALAPEPSTSVILHGLVRMPHLLGEAPFGARGWLCISYHGLGSLCLRGTNTNLGVLEGLLEASGSPGSWSELILCTHKPSLVTQQTTRTSKCRVTRQPNKQRGNASLALEAAPCALTARGAGVRLPGGRSARLGHARVTRVSPQLCPCPTDPSTRWCGSTQPPDATAQNNAASYNGLLCYKWLLETSP